MLRTLTLALSALPLLLPAQSECGSGRYTDAAYFDSVVVSTGVVFGANTGVFGSQQTLRLDVYEPYGDALAERPVVIVAFGGSFVAGSRADVAPLCRAFAKLGYVAIAPDYRVGLFFPNPSTTAQAVMRGTHDLKACVRYLRKTVGEDGNPWRIDTERIIVGGISAGAISALHATYLDRSSEIPTILHPDSTALGGVEGNSGSPGWSSAVAACFSFSGAIGDTLWIEPADKPVCSVHETGDGVVPCWTQEVSVLGLPAGIMASGSGHIHQRAQNLGLEHCVLLYQGNTSHVGYLSSDYATSFGLVSAFCANIACDESATCGTLFASIHDANPVERSSVRVYPNPASDVLRIELDQATALVLLDGRGNAVWRGFLPIGTNALPIADLAPGVYVLHASGLQPQGTRIVIER